MIASILTITVLAGLTAWTLADSGLRLWGALK